MTANRRPRRACLKGWGSARRAILAVELKHREQFDRGDAQLLEVRDFLDRSGASNTPQSNPDETGERHRWMYDRFSLDCMLRQAGFAEPRVCAARESAIPEFDSYCLDVDQHGAVRKPDSLFMEACKP